MKLFRYSLFTKRDAFKALLVRKMRQNRNREAAPRQGKPGVSRHVPWHWWQVTGQCTHCFPWQCQCSLWLTKASWRIQEQRSCGVRRICSVQYLAAPCNSLARVWSCSKQFVPPACSACCALGSRVQKRRSKYLRTKKDKLMANWLLYPVSSFSVLLFLCSRTWKSHIPLPLKH